MDIQVSIAPIQTVTREPDPVTISDAAVARIQTLIGEEGNPALKLRVTVSGGGCSGYQYGFEFDESIKDNDTVVERDGVTMLVDRFSHQYIGGGEIDYLEGLEGARFVINNPNATSTCGCGSSFSI